MPYVRISIAARLDAGQVVRLQRSTTELMARLLGKNPDLTVVSVSQEDPMGWSVGGMAIQGHLAQLQAVVTEGTNTLEEKAAFISAARTLLIQVLGDLAGPLYVVVDEVPAANWGYDGVSQLARRQSLRERKSA